jgi:hypothetical protein
MGCNDLTVEPLKVEVIFILALGSLAIPQVPLVSVEACTSQDKSTNISLIIVAYSPPLSERG